MIKGEASMVVGRGGCFFPFSSKFIHTPLNLTQSHNSLHHYHQQPQPMFSHLTTIFTILQSLHIVAILQSLHEIPNTIMKTCTYCELTNMSKTISNPTPPKAFFNSLAKHCTTQHPHYKNNSHFETHCLLGLIFQYLALHFVFTYGS